MGKRGAQRGKGAGAGPAAVLSVGIEGLMGSQSQPPTWLSLIWEEAVTHNQDGPLSSKGPGCWVPEEPFPGLWQRCPENGHHARLSIGFGA